MLKGNIYQENEEICEKVFKMRLNVAARGDHLDFIMIHDIKEQINRLQRNITQNLFDLRNSQETNGLCKFRTHPVYMILLYV